MIYSSLYVCLMLFFMIMLGRNLLCFLLGCTLTWGRGGRGKELDISSDDDDDNGNTEDDIMILLLLLLLLFTKCSSILLLAMIMKF
jgi:hypothetical protein